jgi:hypothetical protein
MLTFRCIFHFSLLPEAVRYSTLRELAYLAVFASQEGFFPFDGGCNHLHQAAVQPGSHLIVLDGRIDLSLHYALLAEAARMHCTLQVVGQLGHLCLARGLFPFDGALCNPLHQAPVQHGSHLIVLDGLDDLSTCRGRPMRCTLRVFAPPGVRAVWAMHC